MIEKRKTPQVMVNGFKYRIVRVGTRSCEGCAAEHKPKLCLSMPPCWGGKWYDYIYVQRRILNMALEALARGFK